MDWKNRIGWTGNTAPTFLFETDDTMWFFWVRKTPDGRYGGLIERHFKSVYPVTTDMRRFPFGKSYKTRKRLLHYAREYAKRSTTSGK